MESETVTKTDGTLTGEVTSPESKEKQDIEDDDDGLKDGWMDILENGQLLKKTLVPGDFESARPERGNKCVINIKTKLKDTGDEVPSETADNLTVFVGDYDVFHGVDLSLGLMHPGETCLVQIHARFAYGEAGKESDVPPNSTLLCEVTLLSVEVVDLEVDEVSLADRIKYGKCITCVTGRHVSLLFFFIQQAN